MCVDQIPEFDDFPKLRDILESKWADSPQEQMVPAVKSWKMLLELCLD